MLDLESIFGDRPATAGVVPAALGPEPQAVATAAADGPAGDAPAGGPDDWRVKHALDYLQTYQPRPVALDRLPEVLRAAFASAGIPVEARWEPSRAVLERDVGLEAVPVEDVSPCPECGSLEVWWDLLGGVHCQHCDGAAFERSGRLLELAERLRRRD